MIDGINYCYGNNTTVNDSYDYERCRYTMKDDPKVCHKLSQFFALEHWGYVLEFKHASSFRQTVEDKCCPVDGVDTTIWSEDITFDYSERIDVDDLLAAARNGGNGGNPFLIVK